MIHSARTCAQSEQIKSCHEMEAAVELQLPGGQITTVDAGIFETEVLYRFFDGESTRLKASDLSWYVNSSRTPYVYTVRKLCGFRRPVYLHRLVSECPPEMEVDHVNRNTLDNRRENLRHANRRMNLANRRSKWTEQGLRGVKSYQVTRNVYEARITVNGKDLHLGTFNTALEAGRAYDLAAINEFGEFATLNFPKTGAAS